MSDESYGFNREQHQRVIKVVRRVESDPLYTETAGYGESPFSAGLLFHAKITAKTAINGAIRWKYTIDKGVWDMNTDTSTGGAWVAGTAPTRTTYYAYNSAEDMNTYATTTGAIGTGNTVVTRSDGTVNGGSCKLVPLPVGGYVVVMFRGRVLRVVGGLTYRDIYYTIINAQNSAQ